MVLVILSGAAALAGALAVWFAYRQPSRGFYVFKPLTTVLILLIPLLGKGGIDMYGGFILAGLGFSLLGDIFLMLPKDRFLAGLGAFLMAHLFYIIAFTAGLRELRWEPALPVFGLAVVAILLLSPYLQKEKLPVYLYIGVISVMAWMAWSRWLGRPAVELLLAACGGVLFMFSDLVLALDRFRGPYTWARAINLSTYYLAQWMIATSVLDLGMI